MGCLACVILRCISDATPADLLSSRLTVKSFQPKPLEMYPQALVGLEPKTECPAAQGTSSFDHWFKSAVYVFDG